MARPPPENFDSLTPEFQKLYMTPEQRLAAHDASLRREVVASIVKDLEAWLPEHRDVSAALYVGLLARVRRHADGKGSP